MEKVFFFNSSGMIEYKFVPIINSLVPKAS